ncbi:MAG: hypothetical protein JWO89_2445 [Verrucomicrobiaceae bacterium]|nr:hypothetical protein [Verrucomicrobiaceae bacterium]
MLFAVIFAIEGGKGDPPAHVPSRRTCQERYWGRTKASRAGSGLNEYAVRRLGHADNHGWVSGADGEAPCLNVKSTLQQDADAVRTHPLGSLRSQSFEENYNNQKYY